jgi:hypothetical protein
MSGLCAVWYGMVSNVGGDDRSVIRRGCIPSGRMAALVISLITPYACV